MKKTFILSLLIILSACSSKDPITPADLSPEAQQKMFELVTEYNSCMMKNRLQMNQTGKDAQAAAQDILQSCEGNLDSLKLHLTSNDVNNGLAEGMVKKLRSRAARQLMTKTMNNLAAQAAAMENAKNMPEE